MLYFPTSDFKKLDGFWKISLSLFRLIFQTYYIVNIDDELFDQRRNFGPIELVSRSSKRIDIVCLKRWSKRAQKYLPESVELFKIGHREVRFRKAQSRCIPMQHCYSYYYSLWWKTKTPNCDAKAFYSGTLNVESRLISPRGIQISNQNRSVRFIGEVTTDTSICVL